MLYTLTTTYPAPGEKEKQDAALKDKLAEIKAGLSEEELQAIIAETNAEPKNEDTSELLSGIKAVTVQSLPEEVRTYSLAEADYAIVPAVSYHARHDYVYEKTKNKAGGVYNTKTHIYLAAADGSYGELCYITHEPAKRGRSDQRLPGATADTEEIWEAVRKRIP